MEIEICNWDKYNTRKDIKNPSWFAFNNRMIEDADIYELTDGEFRAWVYCLSRASQNNNAIAKIDTRHAERVSRIDPKDISKMIEKMESVHIIKTHVRMRTESVQAHRSRVTDKQTNKQTDT